MTALKAIRTAARRLVWFASIALVLPNIDLAQAGNGGISGVVSDPSGGVIANATVTVKSDATGVVLTKKTTAAGVYSFTSLPPMTYQVTISDSGFQTSVHSGVIVWTRPRRSTTP